MQSDLLNPNTFFGKLDSLSDEQLLDFIDSWHERGETAEELQAFANYIFAIEPRLDTGFKVYDCAGTGGDGANTFNISTTAAIIAAGAGLRISKNGGRSTTSKSGSVDVLEALGFNFNASYQRKLEGLERHNLAFFASQVTGKLLIRVKTLCRQAKRTAFISLLGPLTSPIKLEGQIIGMGQRRWLEPLEGALKAFIEEAQLNRAIVLRSTTIRFDELSSCSDSELSFIFKDKTGTVSSLKYSFSPEDIGLKRSTMSELTGGNAADNAAIIRGLLDGSLKDLPKLETACLNAALLLLLDRDLEALVSGANFANLLRKNYELASELVCSGKVWANFQDLLALLNS